MTIETRACWQPWDSLNVAADGKVYPCCVVNVDLEIGDLNTAPLEQIAAGDKAVALKRKIIDGDLGDLPCQDCCNAPMVPIDQFKQAIRDRFFASRAPLDDPPVEAAAAPIDAPTEPEASTVEAPALVTLKTRVKRRVIRLIEQL